MWGLGSSSGGGGGSIGAMGAVRVMLFDQSWEGRKVSEGARPAPTRHRPRLAVLFPLCHEIPAAPMLTRGCSFAGSSLPPSLPPFVLVGGLIGGVRACRCR